MSKVKNIYREREKIELKSNVYYKGTIHHSLYRT